MVHYFVPHVASRLVFCTGGIACGYQKWSKCLLLSPGPLIDFLDGFSHHPHRRRRSSLPGQLSSSSDSNKWNCWSNGCSWHLHVSHIHLHHHGEGQQVELV